MRGRAAELMLASILVVLALLFLLGSDLLEDQQTITTTSTTAPPTLSPMNYTWMNINIACIGFPANDPLVAHLTYRGVNVTLYPDAPTRMPRDLDAVMINADQLLQAPSNASLEALLSPVAQTMQRGIPAIFVSREGLSPAEVGIILDQLLGNDTRMLSQAYSTLVYSAINTLVTGSGQTTQTLTMVELTYLFILTITSHGVNTASIRGPPGSAPLSSYELAEYIFSIVS